MYNLKNLNIINHPLVKNKISMIRDVKTNSKDFREITSEIATLICYEATKNLELKTVDIESVLCKTKGEVLSKKILVVPILRAGMGMVDGILNLIPNASVGHIGLYRDPKTLLPVEYYCKLPKDSENTDILLIDPMLATGGTVVSAIQILKDKGFKNIKFLCIVSCSEGVKNVNNVHPDVQIYAATLDEKLNEHGYILPGLGDAGDRMFGTK